MSQVFVVVAASMADINIEEESFWQESLQSIADQIQDFLKELSA